MRKRILLAVAVGSAALLVVGVLSASNMGFKLNLSLPDNTTTQTGTTVIGLPFNPQSNLVKVSDLLADMNAVGGSSNVANISRLDRSSDGLITYNGTSEATNFLLDAREAYFVNLNPSKAFNYIVVGSHDPAATLTFYGPSNATPDGPSNSGANSFSMPYHTTLTNAASILVEINAVGGGTAGTVSAWNDQLDGLNTYNGTSEATNFIIAPGKGYIVGVNAGADIVGYIPSHF